MKEALLTTRELRRVELPEAANLLGRAMCDNPIIIRVFRISDTERRARALEHFFIPVLAGLHRRGILSSAFSEGSLAGVCGMAPPGSCRPKWLEVLGIVPSLMAGNRPATLVRVKRWVGEWARRDLAEPHWHLGPVAVDARFRGQGIGTAMLRAFCSRMNDFSTVSYLETDKYTNVCFYRELGFEIVGEADVLGVLTWFMRRPDVGSADAGTCI
jgi:ribosomal protein S18 acetylase RimI-like enzyme